MSIYQAYYDRAPVLMIAGRDFNFIAAHSAVDIAGMVRIAFDPLKIERGDRYRVTLRAHDATPSSRPALAYARNRSAELLRFDDRPLDGSLELEEVFE